MIIETLEGFIGIVPDFDAEYEPFFEQIRHTGRLDVDAGFVPPDFALMRASINYASWASRNRKRRRPPIVTHKPRVLLDRSRVLIEHVPRVLLELC